MLLFSILKPSLRNISIWINTLFLLGLLLFGWADSFSIVIIYFLETLLIGFLQIIKMTITGLYGEKQKREGDSTIALILFFIVHYSMFVGIQSVFVFLFFESDYAGIKEPFQILSNFRYALSFSEIRYGLLIIFCGLFFQMIVTFLRDGKQHKYTTKMLMFQPYLRIFVQQFAVIISGFFIILFSNGLVVALLLILFRLFIDLTGAYIGSDKVQKQKISKFLSQKEPEKESDVADMIDLLFD